MSAKLPSVIKFYAVLCFFSVSIAVSLVGCYWVAERYYFDKFFYQKSEAHGYWASEDGTYHRLKGFGSRAEDILALQEFIHEEKDSRVLGATAANELTVALFGDSYVWGAGVREQQRFAYLLEEKLNEYRPTKVLVFAVEGDNIVDQWRKYQALLRTGTHVDLFLFGVVHNDAFLKKQSWYGLEGQDRIDQCPGEEVWDVSEDWADIDVFTEYPKRVKRSLEHDTKNVCVVQQFLSDFPKSRALYIDLDSLLTSDPASLVMADMYRQAGFHVLSFDMIGPDHSEEQERLFISEKERHPSILAHQVYAREIVKALVNDPRFGFIERQLK